MGKLGLTDVFIEQVENAIEKRELIKFVILQNSDEDLDDVANKIADEIGGVIIQTIGSTAILYRPSSKEKTSGNQSTSKSIKLRGRVEWVFQMAH